MDQSIRANTTVTSMRDVQNRLHAFDHKKESEYTKEILDSINTKYASINHKVSQLSGGNQQKVALAKWLAAGEQMHYL